MKIQGNILTLNIDEIDAEMINKLIQYFKVDTNQISDGFHTMLELYNHRIELFIALCKQINEQDFSISPCVWKSKKHSDGSEWEGWFILGIYKEAGEQITYHLPMSYWEQCAFQELVQAPEYDGHTSEDVLNRIKNL